MPTSSKLFQIALISVLFVASCTKPHEINTNESARILKILSSDEMKGRYAFSPEIRLAEDFIASEFKQAGLKFFDGLGTYRQEFTITESSISNSDVILDGSKIQANLFFGFIYSESVQWNQDSVKIEAIAEGENFRANFGKYRSSSTDLLVIVHSSFEDIFSRYQSYFSDSNRFLDATDQANIIFVLANNNPSSFNISITTEQTKLNLANVTGVIEGKRTDEFVLFSAHHDHIGVREVASGDSVANGANDNASGVTAVIELAHYFSSLPKPERSIIFTTFTAEEMGGYGSQYFSKQLNPDNIVAMFNIEMIGKPAVSGSNTAWITGYDQSTFGELLAKSAEGSIYEFYPDPYPEQNLFYRSDNATLARLGVPAHSISTTPIDVDRDYHQVSDEYQTIDIQHLTNTIRAIAKAAEGMVSGLDTPTRIASDQID